MRGILTVMTTGTRYQAKYDRRGGEVAEFTGAGGVTVPLHENVGDPSDAERKFGFQQQSFAKGIQRYLKQAG